MPEVTREWLDFESNAIESLRQRGKLVLMQVLDWPSFELPAAWTLEMVARPSADPSYRCSYSVWSRYDDYQRHTDPLQRVRYVSTCLQPTITRRVVDAITAGEVHELLALADALPALRPGIASLKQGISVDGFRTEVAISNGVAAVRYAWANELPEQWAPLLDLATSIRSFVRDIGRKNGWLHVEQSN